jgi:hypothetical protein
MTAKNQDDKITVVETEQRLRAVLKGAFAGTPTQLKNIPKNKSRLPEKGVTKPHK